MNKLQKNTLSLAGEYAVAAELCRRGIDAQVTLGHAKRTDILAYAEHGRAVRVEVKAKQGKSWPNLKGVTGPDIFLVLVDFWNIPENQRPGFYVLTSQDWKNLVDRWMADPKNEEIINKWGVNINTEDGKYVTVWTKQVNKAGKPYEGVGPEMKQVTEHVDKWCKIVQTLQSLELPS